MKFQYMSLSVLSGIMASTVPQAHTDLLAIIDQTKGPARNAGKTAGNKLIQSPEFREEKKHLTLDFNLVPAGDMPSCQSFYDEKGYCLFANKCFFSARGNWAAEGKPCYNSCKYVQDNYDFGSCDNRFFQSYLENDVEYVCTFKNIMGRERGCVTVNEREWLPESEEVDQIIRIPTYSHHLWLVKKRNTEANTCANDSCVAVWAAKNPGESSPVNLPYRVTIGHEHADFYSATGALESDSYWYGGSTGSTFGWDGASHHYSLTGDELDEEIAALGDDLGENFASQDVGGEQFYVEFTNNTDDDLDLFWIDFDGNWVEYTDAWNFDLPDYYDVAAIYDAANPE